MNLRDLEYLVAVAELRHFRRAAERCCVSQPTLSGQLRKLEQTLGVQLLERDSRNVRITQAGEAIVTQARRVLGEVRGLSELAQSFARPDAGRLRLGLIPTVGPYLLPLILPGLAERYPELEWLLKEGQTRELVAQLKEGQLDLLILAQVEELQGLEIRPLYRERLLLAVSRDHPYAARVRVTPQHLDGESVLLLEDGHCLRDQAGAYCFSAGAHEDGRFRATSLETLRYMVGAGSGITLMPELARSHPQGGDQVRYLPFSTPEPQRQIVLAYRPGYARAELAAAIADEVGERMRQSDKLTPSG